MTFRSFIIWLTFILFVVCVLALIAPVPSFLLATGAAQPVKILDRTGILLYEVRAKDFGSQQILPFSEIPKNIIDAVIAIEDRDYFHHSGISVRGIGRAAWQDVTTGRIISGGSTITQQLVRNRVQPLHRTLLYKIEEAFLALKLEQSMSKEDILAAYLNSAYFGHQAYGIAAAARTYFGVHSSELSPAQAALLAGLVQSPVALDPFLHPSAAKERQKRVLIAMKDTHMLTEIAYSDALREPIHLSTDRVAIHAPHFVFWVLDQEPGTHTQGDTIRTTLDFHLQQDIERIVERNLASLAKKNVTSAAVVVLDAHTGDVLSMIGSADYFDALHDGAVNVATSLRQPGSALKPFTYALAFSKGDTAATTVSDVETQFFTEEGNPYTPRNYDFGFHGLVRYREALANSYNVAAVKVAKSVGIPALMGLLRAAGITSLTQSPEHYGLALTLGDAEVSLLELTRAYGVFARGGKSFAGEQILDPRTAWLITDILSDANARLPQFGENGPLSFDFPVAAKTGTTRNSRDNWTIGYTPDVLVGVWVGNADNSPMQGTSGVTGAGPIFHDVMLRTVKDFPPHPFAMPKGMSTVTICRLSGMLPGAHCPQTMPEHFIAGSEPKKDDTMFQEITIDRRNNLRASDACPAREVDKKIFAVFPPETQKWARENGWPQPPSTYSPLCDPTDTSVSSRAESRDQKWLTITHPHSNDAFRLDPLIPDSKEKVVLEAEAAQGIASVDWYVNGKKIATAHAPDFHATWQPKPGTWTIEARSGDLTDHVMIEVEE